MAKGLTITDRVLEEAQRTPTCHLSALVERCAEFTGKEVLQEVHRLNKTGELLLVAESLYSYSVRLRRAHESPTRRGEGSSSHA